MKKNFKAIFFRNYGRFAQVDGLRAIAILWVFLFHIVLLFAEFIPQAQTEALFGQSHLQWMLHGHFGVDIFFIISGFLIGDLLIGEVEKTGSIRFWRFYVRRTIRLAPLYYLVIAVVFTFGWITQDPKLNISNAWANLIYVNNFLPDLEQFMPWTWSLAVEEQFYLLCPLLIFLMARQRMNPITILCVLAVAGFALNILIGMRAGGTFYFIIHPSLNPADTTEFSKYYDLLYDNLHNRFVALLLGVLIAYLIRRAAFLRWMSNEGVSVLVLVVAMALIYAVLAQIKYDDWRTPVGALFMATYRYWFAIGIALLLLLTFTDTRLGRGLSRLLSLNFWYPVAQTSYSAYLVQPVVIFMAIKGWYVGQAITTSAIVYIGLLTAAITFAIAVLLYALVEKPFMDMRPK